MNDIEVIQELRAKIKPYIHIGMPQSVFSNTLIRQEAGLLKPKTFIAFMEKFGYVKVDGLWKTA